MMPVRTAVPHPPTDGGRAPARGRRTGLTRAPARGCTGRVGRTGRTGGGPGGAAAAIVLAGGSGTRVGGPRNKVYLPLAGRSVISWSLDAFGSMPGIGPVVLVVRAADRSAAERVLDREVDHGPVELVTGGATRQESELAGLRHLAGRIDAGAVDTVLIHDGARPLMTRTLAAAVLHAARRGGAVPGIRRGDVAVAAPDGDGLVAMAPEGCVAVQTPQGFPAAPLLEAYEQAGRAGFAGTDTASCIERFAPALDVRWIAGDPGNIKITYARDLAVAEQALARLGHRPG